MRACDYSGNHEVGDFLRGILKLGATRDCRLVEPLRKLPWPEGQQGTDLALERARTLLRLGDWEMVPLLIGGLRDERLITRALCIQALSEATHERYEFDARGEPDAREKSVRQWEQWWHDHQIDPIQGVKHDAPNGAPPTKSDMPPPFAEEKSRQAFAIFLAAAREIWLPS